MNEEILGRKLNGLVGGTGHTPRGFRSIGGSIHGKCVVDLLMANKIKYIKCRVGVVSLLLLYAEAETLAIAICSTPNLINKGTKEATDRMQVRYFTASFTWPGFMFLEGFSPPHF